MTMRYNDMLIIKTIEKDIIQIDDPTSYIDKLTYGFNSELLEIHFANGGIYQYWPTKESFEQGIANHDIKGIFETLNYKRIA